LSFFIHGARGTWQFTPTDSRGTLIEWTHAFRPTRFRNLATRLLIAPLWRPYMRQALAATVREINRKEVADQRG
jgi:hypothetical protein